MKAKNKVTASAFLDWYFSDSEMVEDLGQRIATELSTSGKATITAKQLFDECGYIPQYICEIDKGDDEYDPSELKLINDLNP